MEEMWLSRLLLKVNSWKFLWRSPLLWPLVCQDLKIYNFNIIILANMTSPMLFPVNSTYLLCPCYVSPTHLIIGFQTNFCTRKNYRRLTRIRCDLIEIYSSNWLCVFPWLVSFQQHCLVLFHIYDTMREIIILGISDKCCESD